MNGYLTEKAVKKRWWDIPVGGFSLLLSVIGIEVCLEEMAGSADFAVSLLASVLVMGLLLAPLFFVTRMQDDRGRIERRLFMRKRGVVQYTKAMSELHRYSSIKEAETVYSISHISGVCRRRRRSDGGYVWRYEDDVDPLSEHFVPARE